MQVEVSGTIVVGGGKKLVANADRIWASRPSARERTRSARLWKAELKLEKLPGAIMLDAVRTSATSDPP